MSIQLGEPVPDLDLVLTGDRTLKLSDYRGKALVLYFYPRANTAGCTQEGQDFRDMTGAFAASATVILGASRDSLRAQENFKAKHNFPFDLIADPDETLCRAFDVIKVKKMYGRESLGVERSTFLIDAAGVLRHEWRAVKVKGHVAEVLAVARALT